MSIPIAAFAFAVGATCAWAQPKPDRPLETESLRKQVRTVAARRAPLSPQLAWPGQVSYDLDRYADLRPVVSGRVVGLRGKVGDRVHRGDLLADIESPKGVRFAIRSPLHGTVVASDLTLGQPVTRDMRAFVVTNLDRVHVYLEASQGELPFIAVGHALIIRCDALSGYVFPGRVAGIDNRVLRVDVSNDGHGLSEGMRVTATARGLSLEVITVPRAAVNDAGRGREVFVRDETGGFTRREVEVGVAAAGLVEIRRGVAEGEVVAVGSAALLKSELKAPNPGGS
jgi:multidrug efflux pump subunit AcrA (membrane-fusion protein)